MYVRKKVICEWCRTKSFFTIVCRYRERSSPRARDGRFHPISPRFDPFILFRPPKWFQKVCQLTPTWWVWPPDPPERNHWSKIGQFVQENGYRCTTNFFNSWMISTINLLQTDRNMGLNWVRKICFQLYYTTMQVLRNDDFSGFWCFCMKVLKSRCSDMRFHSGQSWRYNVGAKWYWVVMWGTWMFDSLLNYFEIGDKGK
jgi:hypothetical protein